jgi:hypothetical protein
MMEAFYNQKKNQYIFAANRCGTNFLNSPEVRRKGWNKQHYKLTIDQVTFEKTATALMVIRDPFERWCSWFENFVISENQISYQKIEILKWIDKFRVEVNEDSHTVKQSVLYTEKNLKFKEIMYIDMSDLNMFFGFDNKKHKPWSKKRYNQLPTDIRNLFEHEIKKIYQEDYEWMKNLPLLTF